MATSTLRSLLTGQWTAEKVSVMHGLELNRAGRLLVDQVVMERRVRSLVSQEVVRQLDLDLLWTHNDHFVEKTNRNLQKSNITNRKILN